MRRRPAGGQTGGRRRTCSTPWSSPSPSRAAIRSAPRARNLAGRAGLPVETLSVPDGGDVAAAIVEHVRAREGRVARDEYGRHLPAVAGSSQHRERRARRLCQPVLLLGPNCSQQVGASTLVVGVDRTGATQHGIDVADAWRRTFGAVETRLVDVVAESSWPAESSDEDIDAPAGATVLRTNDAAAALVALGETIDDAVFVLTSDRWPGGRSHWYSTTLPGRADDDPTGARGAERSAILTAPDARSSRCPCRRHRHRACLHRAFRRRAVGLPAFPSRHRTRHGGSSGGRSPAPRCSCSASSARSLPWQGRATTRTR